MRSPAAIKVGLVAVLGLILVFAVTDALAAHDAHGVLTAATVRVRIQHCGLDTRTHLVQASGVVVNGTAAGVSSYRFSVAFTDAAGDEEDEPASVARVPAGGRQSFTAESKSSFPSAGVHCALADLNVPGDL